LPKNLRLISEHRMRRANGWLCFKLAKDEKQMAVIEALRKRARLAERAPLAMDDEEGEEGGRLDRVALTIGHQR
jgi:hypothetical protein